MIRNVRILVEDAAQAAAAQEYLFANGCKWTSGDRDVRTLYSSEKISLFVSPIGNITWGGVDSFADKRGVEILELEFQNKMKVVSSKIKERPKTVLFGKTYFTDELEARLAGLEVANGRA
ncbi:hypothetical protein uav_074 [Pseudomonas phage UAVern]|uniref:Uncharacterized protein n=1 Tax=Pseudomonas phage UAVern TaxID=2856997 RepID=A0A975UUN4_9CAUD|nr:hypothetical protein uav_074 [Pseudomonas phage UAVern]